MASDGATIEKEKGSWLSFFAKLFFFLIVLFVIAIMVLSSLGGNSDVLRSSIEEYLSKRFGGVAEIETFNQMTFYPYMGIDMAGVNVYQDEAKTRSIFSADKITAAMGFWDLAFSSGQIKTLDVRNLRALPGTIINKGLTMDQLAIIDEGDKAYIRSNGKIGSSPYSFEADILKVGKGADKSYKFGDQRPFVAKLGDVNMRGTLENIDVDAMNVSNFSIGLEQPVFSGNAELYYGGQQRFKVKGEFVYGTGSTATPDILIETLDNPVVSGDLIFQKLLYSDAQNYEQIFELSDALHDVIANDEGDTPYDLDGLAVDMNVNIEQLVHNDITIGSMRFPVKLNEGDLHIGPLESGFQGGTLKGDIFYKTSVEPAEMTQTIQLNDWNYGVVMQAFKGITDVEGNANIYLNIQSKGNTENDLKNNASGHFLFAAGEGQFPIKALYIWDQGVMNAMFPELDQNMLASLDCAVSDFKIENGEATANIFSIIMDELSIQASGTYSLVLDRIDMQVEPNAKSADAGNVATAVGVVGPLEDLRISRGLPRQSKEPIEIENAEKYFSEHLGDLGLDEDHPCMAYVDISQPAE